MSSRLATVKSEIHNVLSTVRLTERSSVLSSRFDSEVLQRDESPIVRRLKSLHDYLLSFDDLGEVDAPTFLEPFLEVLRTPTSNGIVTGVALSSLNKLLLYGSLTAESPRTAEAVNLAVEAVCNCKFEASNHYSDEVVMLQILEVLVSLLRCPVGDRLTEENVWSLVQVCYHMAIDPSLSELLRAAAANSLSHVILTVFSRSAELATTAQSVEVPRSTRSSVDEAYEDGGNGGEFEDDEPVSYDPYTSRLLTRILTFLAKLTDVSSVSTTLPQASDASNGMPLGETLRAMGLQLINIALETAGESLGNHVDCVHIIQNELCKYLLTNSQTDDVTVLALTLRVVYNLFSALRNHLKVQLEVFLNSVHFRIVNSATASNEKKELALESLLDFCQDPTLVLDLHANYDCDVNCSNLFEGLTRVLCKQALPGPTGLTALNVLALDGVYSILSHIAARCVTEESSEVPVHADNDTSGEDGESGLKGSLREDELLLRKTHKRRLLLAVSQFNKAPTKPYWKEYARELGILVHLPPSGNSSLPSSPKQLTSQGSQQSLQIPGDDAANPPQIDEKHVEELADFLLNSPALDKGAIGEYLSEKDNGPVLRKYLERFDMKGLRIDLALRRVLECFRIPGEAQKIERVMEAFSSVYFKQNAVDTIFANSDAVFIFAFSIVMLHTDRHSRSIPDDKRMTEEQFKRNVRGINDGKDLDPDFLSQVFHAVSEKEFMLSYDASSESPREWDVILRHSSKVEFARFSKRGHFRRAGLHEKDMLEMLVEPALQAMDAALHTTQDGRVVIRTVRCAEDFARAVTYFGKVEEFNQVLIMLCRHYFNLAKRGAKHDDLPALLVAHVEQLEAIANAETEIARLWKDSPNNPDSPRRHAALNVVITSKSQRNKAARTGYLLGVVENYAGLVSSPVRLLVMARSVMNLAQRFGDSARESWANAIRVVASLKSERLVPPVTKDDVALYSEDQRLLSAERDLFESHKARLPPSDPLNPSSPRAATISTTSTDVAQQVVSDRKGSARHRGSDLFGEGGSMESDSDVSSNSANELHNQESGLWTTVASFLFGGARNGNANDERSSEDLDIKQTKEYKRAARACQSFFRTSGVYLELFRSTWSLSEQSLAHLLTALSSPFSDSKPSWCSTNEFTPPVACSFLELMVLVSSANRARFDQLAPYLDTAIAYALTEHMHMSGTGNGVASEFEEKPDYTQVILHTAVREFFQASSLRSPPAFELLPLSQEALLKTVDSNLAPEVCSGLEETRKIEGDDLPSWKIWSRLLAQCLVQTQSNVRNSSKRHSRLARHVLVVVEHLIEDDLVSRSNVALLLDVLVAIVSSPALAVDKAHAVHLIKILFSGKKYTKTSSDGQESSPSASDNGEALWMLALTTLKQWWDMEEVEGETSDALAAIILQGFELDSNTVDHESQLRRMLTTFERVLFPLVHDSKVRRGEAISLLTRVFLICAGSEASVSDPFIDATLKPVIEIVASEFDDPSAADDSKESAVQRILNIVNIVVANTPKEEERMKSITPELNAVLPSNWRSLLIKDQGVQDQQLPDAVAMQEESPGHESSEQAETLTE